MYYVNGIMEHFEKRINKSSDKQLDNGLIMHYNIFSQGKQNQFILEFLGIDLKGSVIIINENESDVDTNLHKRLSKNKLHVERCESCGDLILSNYSANLHNKVNFQNNCKLRIENFDCKHSKKHNHWLCDSCQYYIRLLNDIDF